MREAWERARVCILACSVPRSVFSTVCPAVVPLRTQTPTPDHPPGGYHCLYLFRSTADRPSRYLLPLCTFTRDPRPSISCFVLRTDYSVPLLPVQHVDERSNGRLSVLEIRPSSGYT